jgi:predicted dehydrogenase
MNDPLIGVGVLGTGVMGQRMMAAMQQHATRLRVAAMYDPDGASLRAAVALAPQARAAADPEDLVGDPAVRLVYIATPPALHLAGVSASLAAGRACLCEKPLSSDVADALAMHRAVHSAGLPFAVNFPFASSTSARRLVGIVRSGELGLLQAATIRLRFSRWPRAWQAAASSWLSGAAEGGFTREVLSHFVFLAQRCFGPATVSDVRLQREPGDAETASRSSAARGVSCCRAGHASTMEARSPRWPMASATCCGRCPACSLDEPTMAWPLSTRRSVWCSASRRCCGGDRGCRRSPPMEIARID